MNNTLKEITIDELKDIQLEILDYVDSFCQKHNIMYSLACGTLLGAIRHKGFIPWDDDIDIQMLRPDYEKFITLFKKEQHERFYIQTKSDYVDIPYAKVSTNDTVLIEEHSRNITGVNIDLFPIDGVKDLKDFNKRHKKVLRLYQWYSIKNFEYSRCPSLFAKLKLAIKKLLLFGMSNTDIQTKIENIAQKYSIEECDYLFEMVAGRIYKNPFHKDAFTSTFNTPFEDKEYHALNGYDEYLKACYGDYMKLPPKEKQVTHHNFKAYWKL